MVSTTIMYTLAMGYDNMHRIKSKSQHLTQDNVQFNGTLNAGYDLSYTYGTDTGKKFQLANVKDVNYRTEETPSESENVNNNHAYEYDANGNLVYVNTSRTKKDGVADEKTAERKLKWDEENRLLASDDNGFVTNYWYDANGNLVYVNTSRTKKDGMTDEKAAERKLKWDEENRLLASDDNGFVTNYWYDADGERTVKTSGESDQVYVNSEFAGGRTNTAKFSLYVSPYLVANQGGRYTKHIYIGSQRVVSKIGDFDSYGSDPRRIQYAGSETDGLSVDYKVKYTQQLQVIKDNYATFAVPYNGEDNNDYVDGKGFCCNDGSLEAAQSRVMARAMKNNFQEGDSYEKMQFYYHPDHLGSSSYITNLDGEVVQHIEYVPFGEVFIEERNDVWNTPYLFNAKEFDEETGMYYYGARYYDPRLSLWMSTDPMQEKYASLSSYAYCGGNPIRLIDSNGMEFTEASEKYISSLVSDIDKRQAKNNSNIAKKEAALANAGLSEKKIRNLNKNISELKANNASLEEVRTEIEILRNSSQIYNVVRDNSLNVSGDILGLGAETRSGARYNVDTDMFDVLLGDNSLGLLAHELKHAYQFETGAYSTGYLSNGAPFYDKSDEIEAYQRGELFGTPAPNRLSSIYDKIQDAPKSVDNFVPDIRNNPTALQRVANSMKCLFRWQGVTYKSKYNPNK